MKLALLTCFQMSLIHLLMEITGENASLESETSSYSWQVIAFHLKCCGLERGRGKQDLLFFTLGLVGMGVGILKAAFHMGGGTGEKWRVVTPGQSGASGYWSQQFSGAYSHGQQFQVGERSLR